MSEFENDFENVEEAFTEAAVNASEAGTAAEEELQADTASEPTEDDFFAEEAAAEVPAVDPMRIITIQTTSASDKFVELNEGETNAPVIDLIHRAGLQFAGDFSVFLNGAQIGLTNLVPGGSTITIAGKVKGG
jgi:hypothetical protein